MGHILPGSQDAYYDHTKIEDLRRKYSKIEFFPHRSSSVEVFRKKQLLDTARLFGFPEEKIKKVEEALAKYVSVDEVMNEITKLRLEGYKLSSNNSNYSNKDLKKIVDEDELESYLANGWDVQTVLPLCKILIRKSM